MKKPGGFMWLMTNDRKTIVKINKTMENNIVKFSLPEGNDRKAMVTIVTHDPYCMVGQR